MGAVRAWLAGLVLALGGVGCAPPGKGAAPGPGAAPVAEHRVAADFLHAFAQLDGYGPGEATFGFARDASGDDPVLLSLERLMRARGYAIRARPGRDALAIVHEVRPDADGAASVHTLGVGPVQLRRRYARTAAGGWAPAGPLFVRGADASGVRPDRAHEADGPPARPPAPAAAPPTRPSPIAPPEAGVAAAPTRGPRPGGRVVRCGEATANGDRRAATHDRDPCRAARDPLV